MTLPHQCGGRTDGYGGFTCVVCGKHYKPEKYPTPGLTKQQLIEASASSAFTCGGCGIPDAILLKDAIALVKQLTEPAAPDPRIERIRTALAMADGWEDGETFYKSTLERIEEILVEPAAHEGSEREATVQEFADALSHVPLSISSTRRGGENGLRNADEVYQALKRAGYRLVKD